MKVHSFLFKTNQNGFPLRMIFMNVALFLFIRERNAFHSGRFFLHVFLFRGIVEIDFAEEVLQCHLQA